MYRDIQRLRRFCKITGQVNCGPKTKDFFCAWYSLDIASKGLACSMELKETLLNLIPKLRNESALRLSMKSLIVSLRMTDALGTGISSSRKGPRLGENGSLIK